MSIREDLKRRGDVADDDIPDIIQLAVQLQAASDEQARSLTSADVAAIAEELDIAPAHVEKAIELRRQARQEAAARAERERLAALEATARRKRLLVRIAIGAGALVVLAALLGWSGASMLSRHHDQVATARQRVDVVLERFAAAAPQQLALVGAGSRDVTTAVERMQAVKGTGARLEAASALHQAVTTALQTLPATGDQSASQMRLNVHYELTGFQNRIATERGRLDMAEAEYRDAASSLRGRLARVFGFGP